MRPLWLLLLILPSFAAAAPPLDNSGDPLPEGASARLGTTRFRLGGAGAAMAFTPDGKAIVSAGWHGALRFWDPATGRELRRIPVRDSAVKAVAFSPDGKLLAAVGSRGAFFVHDVDSGKELKAIAWSTSPLLAVAFSPDGKLLASAGAEGVAAVLETGTYKALHILKTHRKTITGLAFSPDSKVLATSSTDHSVRLWDVASGLELFRIRDDRMEYDSVLFSTDGQRLLVGGQVSGGQLADDEPDAGAGRLQVWEVAGLSERLRPDAASPERLKQLVTDLDSRQLDRREQAARELEKLGKLAEAALKQALTNKPSLELTQRIETLLATLQNGPPLPGHQRHVLRTGDGPVGVVALTRDGEIVAVGKDDGVRFWQTSSAKELPKLPSPAGGIQALAFAPDGKSLACSAGNTLLLHAARTDGATPRWEFTNWQAARTHGHVGTVGGLSFATDGATLASFAWGEKQLRLWDTSTGKQLRTIGEGINFNAVAFTADGKGIATGADREDGSRVLHVWLTENDRLLRKMDVAGTQWLHPFQFSPDGKIAAAVEGAGDPIVRRWDLAEGKELAKIDWAEIGSAPAVFSDGRTLAAGLQSKGAFAIRDTGGDGERHRPGGLGSEVTRLVVSADGKLLVTHGDSARRRASEIRVWETATGKELHKIDLPLGQATGLALAADGRTLAVGGNDGVIRLVDLATGEVRRKLTGPAPVEMLAFTADGKRLAAAGQDTAILIWPVAGK